VLLLLFAAFAVAAVRFVDVSMSRTALVAFATLHVLGALSILAVVDGVFVDVIPSLPGWRRTASLPIVFVVALVVLAPLAAARWRNLDRTDFRFVYRFTGVVLVFELARATVDGFDMATLQGASLVGKTPPQWSPVVFVWSLPILPILGLVVSSLFRGKLWTRQPYSFVLAHWAVLAGVIYFCARNHAGFGEAESYVRFYLIPALAIGLELGTLPWLLVLANADPANDALLARLGPPPPSLATVLRRVVGIGWPALSSAAMVVVAATFMAIDLPSAPKQTGSTQAVTPAGPNQASPALDLGSFPTPVLASPTVLFDLNSVTLSPQALATIGGLAATFKKNRGASIILRGYADIAEDQKTDADIGVKRAAAVRDALIKDGVPGQSIFAQGFAAQPGTPTAQSGQARQSGRVDIFVLAAPSTPPSNQAAPSAPTKQQAQPSKK
jgi:outer membrane protein OmpA-like peptidoglycan-associated protein